MSTSMSTYVTRFGHFVFGNPTTSPMGDSTLSPVANVCEPRTLHSEASRVNEQSSRQHAAPKAVVATDTYRLVCHRHGTLGPLPSWSSGPAQHPGEPGRRRAPPQGARRGWFARGGIVVGRGRGRGGGRGACGRTDGLRADPAAARAGTRGRNAKAGRTRCRPSSYG